MRYLPIVLALFVGPASNGWSQVRISGPSICPQGQVCKYTATRGKAPYVFSVMPGSVGSIDPSTGDYTAPAHIAPKQVINGCQGLPNNSIINTRIDTLPVHPKNSLWMSNVDPNYILFGPSERLHGSVVLSTDPSQPMNFVYGPPPPVGTPFIFVPFPDRVSENGSDFAKPGFIVVDNHILTTYRDTCQQQEIYNLYPTGTFAQYPRANGTSGVIYPMNSFANPGNGTDAAQMPISPLMIHMDELVSAAGGNIDAIQHAVRFTLDNASIDKTDPIWPGQVSGGNANCQKSGTEHSNCPPYGARFRLKASYKWSGFSGICSTEGCRNIVKAIIRQQQRYGFILSDVGSSWNADFDGGGYMSADVGAAVRELYLCRQAACGHDGLRGDSTNYEIVDESGLNTNPMQTKPMKTWLETKINNGKVKPDDAAVIQVTDAASHTGYFSIALQGVAIGVPNPIEVVMAGAGPIQFSPWVTGSSNTAFSCSLTPSRGANGTITKECLYTPPVRSAVSTRTDTTVTVTAAADSAATKTFRIVILPVAADGKLYISLGKVLTTPSYTDKSGNVWWNDMPVNQPLALFPDSIAGGGGGTWTGGNADVAPGIYTQGLLGGGNDMHFRIRVPNGNVTGTLYGANIVSTGPNQSAFSFDCNGVRQSLRVHDANGVTDMFTYAGKQFASAPMSCTQTVSNGLLHMVMRWQGVNFGRSEYCSVPCYSPQSPNQGIWAAGLVVSSTPYTPPEAPRKK